MVGSQQKIGDEKGETLERQNNHPRVDQRYVRPQKAFERMRAAQSVRKTVYLYGGTGYGKTSFAADFLSRRRYEYYELQPGQTDIAPLLEALCRPDRREPVVVLDGVQFLSGEDQRLQIYPVLEQLIAQPDIWVILISRADLPAWLKPLHIQYLFVSIGEEQLRLNESEMRLFFQQWDLELNAQAEQRLCSLSAGNPMFLRTVTLKLLPLMQSGRGDGPVQAQRELETIEEARKDWWDVLESRVFNQWDAELQGFLSDLSVVERFDLAMAQKITQKSDAARCILAAQEAGTFLTETVENGRPVYEMVYPAKAALRRRLASRSSQQHINALYTRAGSACELQGRTLEALSLYTACGDDESIARLLIENSRRYVGTGHYWEMRRYYLALSDDTIRQSPELMFGMSMLQSIMMNDEESDRWYEELQQYTRRQTGCARQEADIRLLFLDFSLPHRPISQMTDLIMRARDLLFRYKNALPELSLTNNQPSLMDGGRDFSSWSRYDRKLARSIGPIVEMVLGKFGKGIVSLALAESLYEKGADSYEVSALASKGRMQAESGGKPEMVFVAVGILTRLSLMNNYVEDALESLQSFRVSAEKDAPHLLPCVDALRTRYLLYLGRSAECEEWLSGAPDEHKEFCTLERYRYMTKARVYLALGRREKALRLLQQMSFFAKKRDRPHIQIEAGVLMAIAQYRLGEGPWQETLQQAVTLAEDYSFVRVISQEGAAVWPLLKTARLEWKNTAYKRRVLVECEHMAGLYPAYMSERQSRGVTLSEKALKVLRFQAQGLSVEQIAQQMGLSRAGVKYYNQETYKKLGVSSKAAAITAARDLKLL